ncbi:LIM domain-containing protein A-like [Galleria mellonella]|uniref:LIM domain-containing protein A-like n=1 Tax=Galleria mellonella TaxID=7137 RepID=A0A6J1WRC5_GALME|nr:LIM domain-containing protein A-like [Galleria mellonella]
MKTLVMFCALAAIAIAAPSTTGEEFKRVPPSQWPEFIKREKKSPRYFAEPTTFTGAQPLHLTSEFDDTTASGRSFGFKKPIIVKKTGGHKGYHLYRDSEEERAQSDPQENCSKQVNVKLCDKNNVDKVVGGRSVRQETDMHDDNMEHSIKMAKEAIENLQRDLEHIEHVSGVKPQTHKPREVDSAHNEFHDEIEVARQALDHIQRNFGNLESMDLKTTTLHDVQDKRETNNHAQFVQEKMAQWKEHSKNNIDNGKNMEDTFMPISRESNRLQFNATPKDKNMEPNEKLNTHEISVRESNFENDAHKTDKVFKDHQSNTGKHDNKEQKFFKDEMKTSETEFREFKMEPEMMSRNTESSVNKSPELSFDVHSNVLKMKTPVKSNEPGVNKAFEKPAASGMKSATFESNMNKHSGNDQNDKKKFKSSETSNFEMMPTNHHNTGENEWNHSKKHNNQDKSTWKHMKSAENSDKFHNKDKEHKEIDPESSARKTTESDSEHHMPKSAGSTEPGSNKPIFWPQKNKQNMEEVSQMKAAGEFHNEHMLNTHMHGDHHQFMHPSHPHNHMHVGSGLEFHTHHSSPMSHAKANDMDNFMQPTLQMSMGDFMGKSALENMLQWAHKDDGGRSAYGPAYGGSGGSGGLNIAASGGAGSSAVGVFPNANVGGCAIPLLLSCSPSVVPGSLTKSGYDSDSGYASSMPAYRANEEHNMHMKREITKSNDKSNTKLKRESTTTIPTMNANSADKKQ